MDAPVKALRFVFLLLLWGLLPPQSLRPNLDVTKTTDSRLQTRREPEIALRTLSHRRTGRVSSFTAAASVFKKKKNCFTCVVGDDGGEGLKHRAGKGSLLWTEERVPFLFTWVQSLIPVSHFTYISALSGVI